MNLITLTTDFGLQDPYVGIMKGVMLGINPALRLVDLTHLVVPQDVRSAAWILANSIHYFPAGTIHLVVVDPGVGSARRAMAARLGDQYFVGPDNGLVSFIWQRMNEDERAAAAFYELRAPRYRLPDTSATFHGRDIFAPAAAHLSLGVALEQFGPAIPSRPEAESEIILFDLPRPTLQQVMLAGTIIYIDHFGNAISTIGVADLRTTGSNPSVLVGSTRIASISHTYADVPEGSPLALVGSSGFLEIAVRNGNAARVLNLRLGDQIQVQPG